MQATDTLATRLGTTVHQSLLLHRLYRLGLKDADAISNEARRRGLDYYRGDDSLEMDTPVRSREVSAEDLIVALMHPCLPWNPQRFRLAAALMAATAVDAKQLANLATQERAVAPVAEIAHAGSIAEPFESFWAELLAHLPPHLPVPSGVMPHPSRYMVIPGKVRPGRVGEGRWVRPHMLPSE